MDDIVEILREEDEKRKLAACENITITEENDALFEAIQEGRMMETVEILYKNPDLINACHRNGGSVIHTAASLGNYELVQYLLKRGADITHLTPEGQSPLDGAVHNIRGRNRPLNEGCLISGGCSASRLAASSRLNLLSRLGIWVLFKIMQHDDVPNAFNPMIVSETVFYRSLCKMTISIWCVCCWIGVSIPMTNINCTTMRPNPIHGANRWLMQRVIRSMRLPNFCSSAVPIPMRVFTRVAIP